MNARSKIVFGLAAGMCFGLASGAMAGPCSEQIADLGRKLSQSPAMGPATTGALGGSNPGNVQPGTQPGASSTVGTSSDNRVGGTAGTKEVNAAVGNVATSPRDVRAQQEGKPTAAAIAGGGSAGNSVETKPAQAAAQQGGNMPDDRMSQAKVELEKARMLDQKDDRTCSGSIDRVRQLMGS